MGIVPLNPQKERSNSDKFLKLPIECGNAPAKLVLLTLKVWRDPLNGKSGRKPCRLLFKDMSITNNVPMLKIFCGNVPVNPQLTRPRMVRFLKRANVSGTGDDILL